MYKFYTIFIFLCVTIFIANSQNSSYADSLFNEKNYKLAAVEYERCFYLSSSATFSYEVLQKKALCYKLSGKYDKATNTLQRINSTYEDYYQTALCLYLSNNFSKSLETIKTAEILFDSLKEDMLLIYILTSNELNEYDSAYLYATKLAEKHLHTTNKNIKPIIDSLYSNRPKLKNEKTGQVLAFIPGLAHIYAGEYLQGITAFTINVAALSFGIWQIIEKCYLSAYLGGAGILSITYPGAMKSGNFAIKKVNYKKISQFNKNVKEKIIKELEKQ